LYRFLFACFLCQLPFCLFISYAFGSSLNVVVVVDILQEELCYYYW